MKEKIKEFVKSKPLLTKLYRVVQSGSMFSSSYKKDIKGKNNQLRFSSSSLFINCTIFIKGNDNEIIVKDTTFFKNVVFHIEGNHNRIVIEKGVHFNTAGSMWMEDDYCEIKIGEKTLIEDASLAVTEPHSKVIIGSDCLFAYDIDIRTGDSHSVIDVTTNKRINYAKSISIGNHVWIASHVSILKGANLPSNSIVATRALVTKPFSQENVLIGGSPATVLKQNINWKSERIYDKEQ